MNSFRTYCIQEYFTECFIPLFLSMLLFRSHCLSQHTAVLATLFDYIFKRIFLCKTRWYRTTELWKLAFRAHLCCVYSYLGTCVPPRNPIKPQTLTQ